MASGSGGFAEALQRIERRELNEAFEACNRQIGLDRYDRTALHRWLAGSVPGREDFVTCLAAELGRPEVLTAWRETRAAATTADVKAVVTRFRGLSAADKLEAFQAIRDDVLTVPASRIRRKFQMRVELHDGPGDDLYELRMNMDWEGYLPGQATTVIVTDYEELGEAFTQEACVFRDVVELDEHYLERTQLALATTRQTLSYSSLDGFEPPVTLEAVRTEGGVYAFGNEARDDARVRVRVSYPFPRGTHFYPIVFRGYQIAGPARITLAVYTSTAYNPRGYAFLGSGRSWQASQLMGRELELDVGTEGSILGEETGIVLYWSERTQDAERRAAPDAGPGHRPSGADPGPMGLSAGG